MKQSNTNTIPLEFYTVNLDKVLAIDVTKLKQSIKQKLRQQYQLSRITKQFFAKFINTYERLCKFVAIVFNVYVCIDYFYDELLASKQLNFETIYTKPRPKPIKTVTKQVTPTVTTTVSTTVTTKVTTKQVPTEEQIIQAQQRRQKEREIMDYIEEYVNNCDLSFDLKYHTQDVIEGVQDFMHLLINKSYDQIDRFLFNLDENLSEHLDEYEERHGERYVSSRKMTKLIRESL